MIRAAFFSVIDQALLSALNLGLSVLLIYFVSKQEYGLYVQLINLQPLFSPLHAGIFVSAYLSLASKMNASDQAAYRASIARVELVSTAVACLLGFAVCLTFSKYVGLSISLQTCAAFALALIGLWWREFVRQIYFANLRHEISFKIDAIYCVSTASLLFLAINTVGMSTTWALWCLGLGAVIAASLPMLTAIRHDATLPMPWRESLSMSWQMGRWEVFGSFVTWGYAQSYVYFAAIHGGFEATAEIAASRLLATPLSLLWASYANVLRPRASQLLNSDSPQKTVQLATHSVGLVIGCSLLYAIALYALIPLVDKYAFGGKFEHLQSLSMWWVAYAAIAGITTIASGVLRSAMQFRRVFTRQVITCIIAIALLSASLSFRSLHSIVIALILVEIISATLLWKSMRNAVDRTNAAAVLQ